MATIYLWPLFIVMEELATVIYITSVLQYTTRPRCASVYSALLANNQQQYTLWWT